MGPVAEYEKLRVSGQVPVFFTVKDAVWPDVFASQVTAVPLGVTDTAKFTSAASSSKTFGPGPEGNVGQIAVLTSFAGRFATDASRGARVVDAKAMNTRSASGDG